MKLRKLTDRSLYAFFAVLVCLTLSSSAVLAPARAAADILVYADALSGGWESWSWDTTIDYSAAAHVHSGAYALAATFTAGWSGLSLHAPASIDASGYLSIDFWAYGGAGGTHIDFYTQFADNSESTHKTLTLPAGAWTHFTIPLGELGSPAEISRLTWWNRTPNPQAVFYLDDVLLAGDGLPPAPPALSVDAALDRQPISPYIYGINLVSLDGSGDAAFYAELDLPVRRWGGNSTSRYNYQNDISNHAMDWYFENIKESSAANLPDDSGANRFIELNRSLGAHTYLVVPMTGYVSNNNAVACGFSIAKYGPQQDSDYWRPDCGNGVHTNGANLTGNDPLDTSFAITPAFVTGWVDFLESRYGRAADGGVMFYNTDNEPDLWFETHRDVSPTGLTYDQWRDRTIQVAAAVKAGDLTAAVLGPGTGVWSYYFESPYDGQRGDWSTPDDRLAHGGGYFTPWLLGQLRAYEQTHGQRLLDYLDLHYYPQSGVALVEAGDASRQALRLRSTRSLWDPTYVDESWIAGSGPDGGIVRLIPRMRDWAAANYPGTQLAIGEYNWGGLEHLNGALAQADVLGIFGREGLGLATLWDPPAAAQPGAYALRMYRNYDGGGGKFGETRLHASSTDQGKLSIYAAQRTRDLALTLMVINKTGGELTSAVSLANFAPASQAQVYRYSAADLSAIQRLPDQPLTPSGFTAAFPANSITLLVLPPSAPVQWQHIYVPLVQRGAD
ncbi:MAG: glycoside hydrolase family 44 protein [Chloroflexota bacterium]